MNKTEHSKKALLEALEKSLGVVTTACKKTEIGRTTYYDWYNNDDSFKKKVDDLQNVALDFAESQLHKQISENSTAATIFYLKTKGKAEELLFSNNGICFSFSTLSEKFVTFTSGSIFTSSILFSFSNFFLKSISF